MVHLQSTHFTLVKIYFLFYFFINKRKLRDNLHLLPLKIPANPNKRHRQLLLTKFSPLFLFLYCFSETLLIPNMIKKRFFVNIHFNRKTSYQCVCLPSTPFRRKLNSLRVLKHFFNPIFLLIFFSNVWLCFKEN